MKQHIFLTSTIIILILSAPTIAHAVGQSNKLLFPKSMFPESDSYKSGFSAGFLA